MHIFMNVGEIIWKTITGKRESKAQRDDLQAVGRMPEMWPRLKPNVKWSILKGQWVLSRPKEKQVKKTIPLRFSSLIKVVFKHHMHPVGVSPMIGTNFYSSSYQLS
ncbi:hypothetical protein DD594_26170 [Enterobacter cloacae complex sp. 4DZ1-17B1]|nr:hypothetical protein DD594_26170 [Enterobacter cloacae complex sp. 4DZ1-17B1]